MNNKSDLYLKKFIVAFIIIEISIIGGFLFFLITFYTNKFFSYTILLFTFLTFLNALLTTLLYVRDPKPEKLISKDQLIKIGPKHLYLLTFFIPILILVYGIGDVFRNDLPMPVPGFYGDILILGGIIWLLVFHHEFNQIFDVIDIYIKDKLYLGTWPAEIRQHDRDHDLEIQYKHWVHNYGSKEELNYYENLSSNSEGEARKFAISRIKQIKDMEK